jgi:hypothetical protein
VNVNVHVGGGGQQRPQWFGDRPQRGQPDRGDHSSEEGGHGGGKRPRPDREDGSSEEGEHGDGNRPRPPGPEGNGTQ